MTPNDLAALRERQNQVAATLTAMTGSWSIIAAELQRIRAEKLERLVASENPEIRGAIKQIDEILQLPNNLHQELLSFVNALPDQGAATDV